MRDRDLIELHAQLRKQAFESLGDAVAKSLRSPPPEPKVPDARQPS
jgi:hypothetical protein